MSQLQQRDYTYSSGGTSTCTYPKVTNDLDDSVVVGYNLRKKSEYNTCHALKVQNGWKVVTTRSADYGGPYSLNRKDRTAVIITTTYTRGTRVFGQAEKDELVTRGWTKGAPSSDRDDEELKLAYEKKARNYVNRIPAITYSVRAFNGHLNGTAGLARSTVQAVVRTRVKTVVDNQLEWTVSALEGIWQAIKNEITVHRDVRTEYADTITALIDAEIAKLDGILKTVTSQPTVTTILRYTAVDHARDLLTDASWNTRKLNKERNNVFDDADTSIGTYAPTIKREYDSATDMYIRDNARETKNDLEVEDVIEYFEEKLQVILDKYQQIVDDELVAKVAADKIIADAATTGITNQEAADIMDQHLVTKTGKVGRANRNTFAETLADFPPTHYSYKFDGRHYFAYKKSLLAALDPVISSTPDDGLPIVDTVTTTDTTSAHIPRRGRNESMADYKARVIALIKKHKDSATAFQGGDGTATPVTTLDDYLPFYEQITKVANYLSGESTSSVNETELGNRYYRDIVARARAEKKFVDAMKDGTLVL